MAEAVAGAEMGSEVGAGAVTAAGAAAAAAGVGAAAAGAATAAGAAAAASASADSPSERRASDAPSVAAGVAMQVNPVIQTPRPSQTPPPRGEIVGEEKRVKRSETVVSK